MAIDGIRAGLAPEVVTGATPTTPAGPAGRGDFADALLDAIGDVRARESEATQAADRFARGEPGQGIHETMIATEKANVALRFTVSVKNKILEAYRDLMNTPV